jgi:GntR family transcriptional regulator
MNFYVDTQSEVPIFRQLMDQVKLHIANGQLKPGDELPSIRSLSVPLGVNPMTISKAYNLLVHEKVLDRRPGLPLVVAELTAQDVEQSRRAQLQRGLMPAVQLARQLEIGTGEAVAIFREMLGKHSGKEDRS